MMNALSFLVFAALYLGALSPSAGPAPAGEFLAAAAAGGVPPPPGSLVAWLLAKGAMLFFSWGNPAYRANVVAALLTAGTVPLLAATLKRNDDSPRNAPVWENIEQARGLATARWLTAFLWGLSPAAFALARAFTPESVGFFLAALAFWSAARRPDTLRDLGAAFFLAGLAAGQWPVFLLFFPALGILLRSAPARARLTPGATAGMAALLLAGLIPALWTLLLSRAAPPLDHAGPDTWATWARYALSAPPFFPPAPAAPLSVVLGKCASAFLMLLTPPGLLLAGIGLATLARKNIIVFETALTGALLPGLLLFILTGALPSFSTGAAAAPLALAALALLPALSEGFQKMGGRWPRLRPFLALLVPAAFFLQPALTARHDKSVPDQGENLLQALPPGAVFWNPSDDALSALLYQRHVLGRRPDVRIARRPDTVWGRAEFRRSHPGGGATLAPLLSPDAFLMALGREAGADSFFTDAPDRLPDVDPATGLPLESRFPEDALPTGAVLHFLPKDSHRLVAPAAQISLTRIPLWAQREGDPARRARDHERVADKFDEFGLTDEAGQERLAALSIHPQSAAARRRLGEAALARGETGRAVIHLEAALRETPRDASLHALLGRALRTAGDLSAARESFRHAVRLNPADSACHLALAEMGEDASRWREAAHHWTVLMDHDPADKNIPWRLAAAWDKAGHPDRARKALGEFRTFSLTPEERDAADAFEKNLPPS